MDTFHLDLAAMRAWCDRNGIRYIENEKLGQIAIPRPLEPGWMMRIIPHDDRGMITFAMPLPVVVPADRQDEVLRAAMLANSATFMGSWVLNFAKGELYFRLTLPTTAVAYSDESVRNLVQITIGTAEAVAGKFKKVISEGASHRIMLDRPEPAKA
jgi:hypothetical protein